MHVKECGCHIICYVGIYKGCQHWVMSHNNIVFFPHFLIIICPLCFLVCVHFPGVYLMLKLSKSFCLWLSLTYGSIQLGVLWDPFRKSFHLRRDLHSLYKSNSENLVWNALVSPTVHLPLETPLILRDLPKLLLLCATWAPVHSPGSSSPPNHCCFAYLSPR